MKNLNTSATIHPQTFERNFYYDDQNLLILDYRNFQVFMPNNTFAQNNINNQITAQTLKFTNYVTNNMFKDAILGYNNSQNSDYPLNPYGATLAYEITYNQNCTLSTYRDEYYYSGGAHGNTTRKSDTYSLKNGRPMPLSSFFKGNVNYKKIILDEILRQAEQVQTENPGIFFEDYKQLIVENFDINSFYLTTEGIEFYFQQYEIAPYVTGIVTFVIPYSLVNNPPSC